MPSFWDNLWGPGYTSTVMEEAGVPPTGRNIFSQPNAALPPVIASTPIYPRQDLRRDIAGYYDPDTASIYLNKMKGNYNPAQVLAHEGIHAAIHTGTLSDADRKALDEVTKDVSKLGDAQYGREFTGQTGTEEGLAQLAAYESFLPAGMNIFQSPLGQELFKSDAAKTAWLKLKNALSPSSNIDAMTR